MRKTLIAAAVLGALAPSFALAQSANVTMYGFLNLDTDISLNVKQDATSGVGGNGPPSGSKQNIYRVSSNVSRFGMRGTESLGGGLNAIFQIEYSVTGDNGGGITASRETFAGLQGSWGTVKIGYFFAPYYDEGAIFSNAPTFRTSILATHSLFANNGFPGATAQNGSFAQRAANSVRYDSPNWGGFTFSGQVGGRDPGGDGGDLNQQRRHAYIISTAATWRGGPFVIGGAYEQHNWLRDGTPANPKLEDKALLVTGSWDFGVVKIGAAYEKITYDVATGGDLKRDYWALSATANIGPGQLYAGYFWVGEGKGSSNCVTAANVTTCPRIGALTRGPDTGAQQWEVSYTYPLSKRTFLYAGYTMIDNERNAAYNYGINQIQGLCTGNAQNAQGNNIGCGDAARPQGVIFGIAHFF